MARTPKKVVAAKKAEDASPSKVAKTHKKEKGKLHRTKTMIEAAKEGREWIERQSRRKTNPTRARKAKKQAPNKELEKVPATLKPIPKKRPVKKAQIPLTSSWACLTSPITPSISFFASTNYRLQFSFEGSQNQTIK